MKVIYKALLLSLLLFACKMNQTESVTPKIKTNILERTKWKTQVDAVHGVDSTLDFHTSDGVKEYIVVNGKEVQGRQGTYKVKSRRVSIKWSKLVSDQVSGVIIENEMKLEDVKGLKTTKYYKIDEY